MTTAATLNRPAFVIGPVGERLTLEKLPASNTVRWTPKRKAEVIAAVEGGLITESEACAMYSIDSEEFAIWTRSIDRAGMAGLRVTRIQHYQAIFA